MNTSNKTDPKAIAIKETANLSNKTNVAGSIETQKPSFDVKKPGALEKPAAVTTKEPMIPANKSAESEPKSPIVEKPESDKSDQPKNLTKADRAKVIYDEMVKDPQNDRLAIVARLKKELGLTKAGAQTYFYKYQKESGRTTEKQLTKMDKAKEVYDRMITDKQTRKDIIAAFVKEVGLTKAGASTYYQNLKNAAAKPEKPA